MLTALDRGWNEVNAQLAQNEGSAQLLFKGMSAPESLTEEEAPRFWFMVAQFFNHHKSVWTLLERDGLDTYHELWLRSDISALYNTPGGWRVFRSLEAWTPAGFNDFVRRQRETKVEFRDWRKLEAD